jgi:hypothetical protein
MISIPCAAPRWGARCGMPADAPHRGRVIQWCPGSLAAFVELSSRHRARRIPIEARLGARDPRSARFPCGRLDHESVPPRRGIAQSRSTTALSGSSRPLHGAGALRSARAVVRSAPRPYLRADQLGARLDRVPVHDFTMSPLEPCCPERTRPLPTRSIAIEIQKARQHRTHRERRTPYPKWMVL